MDKERRGGAMEPLCLGWGMADITPPPGIRLGGLPAGRTAGRVLDLLTVTALAIRRGGEGPLLWLSADLYAIGGAALGMLADALAAELEGFTRDSLLCSGTHSHTAPDLSREEGGYWREIFLPQAVRACAAAVKALAPSGIASLLGHAVTGHCFRVRYRDGTADAYTGSDEYHFDCLEGPTDTGVQFIYIYDERRELSGVVISFPCPSEAMRGEEAVSADIPGRLKREIAGRLGKSLPVLAVCACCGDMSTRCLIRRGRGAPARSGPEEAAAIADRLADAFEEGLARAAESVRNNADFAHAFLEPELPLKAGGTVPAPMHLLRLGDTAVVTNPFEMYGVYGMRMRARIGAEHVMTAQLTDGYLGYMPTLRAQESGGYSTGPGEAPVTAEGGELFTERAVEAANRLMRGEASENG